MPYCHEVWKDTVLNVLWKSFSSFLLSRQNYRNRQGKPVSLNILVEKYTVPSRTAQTLIPSAPWSFCKVLVASRIFTSSGITLSSIHLSTPSASSLQSNVQCEFDYEEHAEFPILGLPNYVEMARPPVQSRRIATHQRPAQPYNMFRLCRVQFPIC